MNRRILGRLAAGLTAAVAATMLFSGAAAAEPVTPELDADAAITKLLEAAEGDAEATAAVERLALSPKDTAAVDIALPGQIFQVPAYSDTGQGGPVLGQLYGAGIATNVNDEFRFGFFGGPGTIANEQPEGVGLHVVYYSLATGASGIVPLNENGKVVPTVLSSAPVEGLGDGLVVAAVYGNLLHANGPHDPILSTVWWPSLGAVLS
ncbi:Tat pathway signal protein [Rhodococcus triatomae]|uniref:Tat pathway signal protein n=1 Tax=Rhodococcus triatomae TaxID=300028 RepID=A0A1G8AI30_9NOCA|nr:Tat pathway signal protein [Rhodococcus triatomae]QNG17760.1 Tat pathway signal protein [Rhodococcus triatomae]QNG22572.1 Tat pathway signal protein [Rhodococcus triatomae]SDH20622.1 hypothetical protein SAMN05444695_101434 [Rhodococcus triatomae]